VPPDVVVPHPMVVMGDLSDRGPEILEGLIFEKLPTQHTSRQELLYALQPDHNSFPLLHYSVPLPIQQQASPPPRSSMSYSRARSRPRCFWPRPGCPRLLVCSISNRRVGLPCLKIHTTRKRSPPPYPPIQTGFGTCNGMTAISEQ
jgi:hypothetical protein